MINDKALNLKMSKSLFNQPNVIKRQLPIDSDTSFDIFFDIFKGESKDYLYIKLVENSAVSPFYYNRSYTLEDLQILHRIFLADNMDQVKEDLKDLFTHNKVKLFYAKNNDGIIMELEVYLFMKIYKINFELYKEIIPEEEKDAQLNNLYYINKRKKQLAKQMYSFLKRYEGNMDQKILDDLKSHFDILDNDENIYRQEELEFENEDLKEIFGIKPRKGKFDKNLNKYGVEIKNTSKMAWPLNFIKFKMDEKSSTIKCKENEIVYPFYEIGINQDGQYYFLFDEKVVPGKYICCFNVLIEGKKLKDTQFKVKIEIKEPL